ncbi:zincin [Patellaria atrata CBS 101060]|uniref:Zincin n=1 Tax=Patellaria atrata CBS 101060 TaxID=1346257 RepID=A0A9P4S832_9PEZI|nr:zincin [Patellaria atrata CBS 101060]
MYNPIPFLASALLLFTLTVLAGEAFKHFDCGTTADSATKDFMKSLSHLESRSNMPGPAAAAGSAMRRNTAAKITVETYFHIITSSPKEGQIKPEMAQSQLDALNAAYSPFGITFDLHETSWTVNDAWAIGADADDEDMKRTLRSGSYGALNIYFQTDLVGNVLGKCTLPSTVGEAGADVYFSDGCNVQANTMPNGTVLGYNLGKTAVHETGHWLGLLHTFEGYSCDGDGDFISDTPFQRVSTDGCPTKPVKDTCVDLPGEDPIHNFMDYSTDACYEGFSEGQRVRIRDMWGMYRDGK